MIEEVAELTVDFGEFADGTPATILHVIVTGHLPTDDPVQAMKEICGFLLVNPTRIQGVELIENGSIEQADGSTAPASEIVEKLIRKMNGQTE